MIGLRVRVWMGGAEAVRLLRVKHKHASDARVAEEIQQVMTLLPWYVREFKSLKKTS